MQGILSCLGNSDETLHADVRQRKAHPSNSSTPLFGYHFKLEILLQHL